MYLISALITALLMLLGPALAFAQTEDPPLEIGSVAVQGSVRTRVEGWDWFTDPSFENAYAYPGTRIRLSFSSSVRTSIGTLRWALSTRTTRTASSGFLRSIIGSKARGGLNV
jgi:hypothetical protein